MPAPASYLIYPKKWDCLSAVFKKCRDEHLLSSLRTSCKWSSVIVVKILLTSDFCSHAHLLRTSMNVTDENAIALFCRHPESRGNRSIRYVLSVAPSSALNRPFKRGLGGIMGSRPGKLYLAVRRKVLSTLHRTDNVKSRGTCALQIPRLIGLEKRTVSAKHQ